MDNKGFGIIDGVMTLTVGIVVTTFIVFAGGMALDSFTFEFQSLDFIYPPVDTFSEAMEGINVLGEMFYTIPIFMLLILTVWFFKGIIFRAVYSRHYDEEEEEW